MLCFGAIRPPDGFRSEDASLRTPVHVVRCERYAFDDAAEKRRGGEQRVEIIFARQGRRFVRNRHSPTTDPWGGPQSRQPVVAHRSSGLLAWRLGPRGKLACDRDRVGDSRIHLADGDPGLSQEPIQIPLERPHAEGPLRLEHRRELLPECPARGAHRSGDAAHDESGTASALPLDAAKKIEASAFDEGATGSHASRHRKKRPSHRSLADVRRRLEESCRPGRTWKPSMKFDKSPSRSPPAGGRNRRWAHPRPRRSPRGAALALAAWPLRRGSETSSPQRLAPRRDRSFAHRRRPPKPRACRGPLPSPRTRSSPERSWNIAYSRYATWRQRRPVPPPPPSPGTLRSSRARGKEV